MNEKEKATNLKRKKEKIFDKMNSQRIKQKRAKLNLEKNQQNPKNESMIHVQVNIKGYCLSRVSRPSRSCTRSFAYGDFS